MDIISIQNQIIQHPEYVENILDKLGYTNVEDKGGYYKFPNLDGDNLGACNIYKDTLVYKNYTRNRTGNIFTLIMDTKQIDFVNTLRWIAKVLNLKIDNVKIKLPFKGFFHNLYHEEDLLQIEKQHVYKSSELPSSDSLSERFFYDGISLTVQEKWGVRYSHNDNAILIPIKSITGDLIGCKARNNDSNCAFDYRWYAYLPYTKTYNLYGLYENYQNIIEKKTVIIFESEKSVLQCASFNLNIAIAVGGCNISKIQAQLIKSLMCEKIIIAFDQDLPEDLIKNECQKLYTQYNIIKNKIGYIYDRDGMLLPLGSKDSPSDRGKKTLQTLLKQNIYYIN